MDTNIIIGVIAGILALVNLIVAVMVWVHKRVVSQDAKDALGYILRYCDLFCDTIELPAKRATAIMGLQSVLGFGIAGKRIYLPTVIVGWLLDGEVLILRWIGVPDLHQWEVKQDENIR